MTNQYLNLDNKAVIKTLLLVPLCSMSFDWK